MARSRKEWNRVKKERIAKNPSLQYAWLKKACENRKRPSWYKRWQVLWALSHIDGLSYRKPAPCVIGYPKWRARSEVAWKQRYKKAERFLLASVYELPVVNV